MKKIMMILAALAVVAGVATAAPKQKAEKKIATVVFTTDLDCHHCAQKVLNTIPYEKGIKDVQVDVPTKTVTVKYDAAKNSVESLTKAFESIKVKVVKIKKVE
ncbi:MAG: cation transporter [Rikenellaceae bacterium]|nr:cation transporter [Rikenellaceae bacterium]